MFDSILNTISNDPTYAKIALVLAGLISVVISIKLFKKLLKVIILFVVIVMFMVAGFFHSSKENPVDRIKKIIKGGKEAVSTVQGTAIQISDGLDVLKEMDSMTGLPDGGQKQAMTQEEVQQILKKFQKNEK